MYEYHFDRAGALTWAAEYPKKRAEEEAQSAEEKAVRETQDLV
jgi:hypothetical protein